MRNFKLIIIAIFLVSINAKAQQWDGSTTVGSHLYRNGKVSIGVSTNTAGKRLEVVEGNVNQSAARFSFSSTHSATNATGVKGIELLNLNETITAKSGIEFLGARSGGVTERMALILAGKEGTWTGSSNSNGFLGFYTREGSLPVQRMRIEANGNITAFKDFVVNQYMGIGSSAPTTKLEVVESTANKFAAKFSFNNTTDAASGGKGIELVNTSQLDNAKSAIKFTGTTSQGDEKHMAYIEAGKDTGWSNTSYRGYLSFWTREGGIQKERLKIRYDGNVGIGVSNPTNKFEVNGKIRGEEVKVEVINAPDYVFADDYQLRTLEATKAYIEQHRHLPEIPSAKAMEANGVELGVMNMALLKKIEEMTLHQITMMEKLKQLEQKVKELSEASN